MSHFTIQPTPIKGLQIIERHPIRDERGYLERLFCTEELGPIIGNRQVLQINHTFTAKAGTLRGFHFQHPPHGEMKLVTCLRGKVFDVAVDIRADSPSFGQHHAEILSANNHKVFAIPEGFAHGFQTLTEDCELLYLHTAPYRHDAEDGLDALDPALAISWPKPISERSARDQTHASITDVFPGVLE